MYDVNEIRKEFPILSRYVHDKPLCYLDNGASAQKPKKVLEAINTAYSFEYANVHRGLHYLSNLATDKFEEVRAKIKKFLGAENLDEIIFTSGTTEGINLVSYGWAVPNLVEGDEIVLSVLEHHANIVPWHFLKERRGIKLKWVEPRDDGSLPVADILAALSPNTKLIAVTHMSNVFGSIIDVKGICDIAKEKKIPVLVDGSQAAVHMKVDVSNIGCDFYSVTGHKLYGPSGSGALFVKKDRLNEMIPFIGGGSMIKEVKRESTSFNKAPFKFEAGTPRIVEMIGLGAAIDFIDEIGLSDIELHEKALKRYLDSEVKALDWLKTQGNSPANGAILSFTMDGGAHPHDISTVLDRHGVAVRAGHHCAQPLMDHLGLSATCRASFAMYNTVEEVDILVEALSSCYKIFN